MRDDVPFRLKRTKPVPPGHCPEPVVEVAYGWSSDNFHWRRVLRWFDACIEAPRPADWPKDPLDGDVSISFRARGISGGSKLVIGKLASGKKPSSMVAFCHGCRIAAEYGENIMDDAADLRLPWTVAPLDGKYYGTKILDSTGEEIMDFWDHSTAAHPSAREKEAFGDWTEDAWADYCCDSHWESERDYRRAAAVVEAMNATLAPRSQLPLGPTGNEG